MKKRGLFTPSSGGSEVQMALCQRGANFSLAASPQAASMAAACWESVGDHHTGALGRARLASLPELSWTPGSCLLKPKTSLGRWTYLVDFMCVFAHMYVCAPCECSAHGLKVCLKSNLVVLF